MNNKITKEQFNKIFDLSNNLFQQNVLFFDIPKLKQEIKEISNLSNEEIIEIIEFIYLQKYSNKRRNANFNKGE